MRVLIACEESQKVCIAFRKRGHEAYSCDIQECSGGHPEWHIQDDVLGHLNDEWDLMIGHPPCTFLSNAGIGWFNEEKYGIKAIERKNKREDAKIFFLKLYNADIPKICIENPVGYMNQWKAPSQIIHPYYFGDNDKKRTCLWLKNLPKLIHIKEEDLFDEITHTSEPEPLAIYTRHDGSKKAAYYVDFYKDAKIRSKTFEGVANAMASQWG